MPDTVEFVSDLARNTGEMLIEYYCKADFYETLKTDNSIVTEADLAADRLIQAAIRKEFPNEYILSEEVYSNTPHEQNDPIWIIDPIDGTTNFSLGLHIWGVLITKLSRGWPVLTAMYFPMLKELFTAQKGEGAYLNNKPIYVKEPDPNKGTAFFACCSRTHREYNVTVPYKARILGSAAYSFCNIARGTATVAFEAKLKIWDIAGAWLLVREAGGIIDSYDGPLPFPFRAGIEYQNHNFPTLAGANSQLLDQTRKQIKPK
jgi:myo-inositol-1(or 4)-monophosphatase